MGTVAESVPLLLERDAELARVSALLAEASVGRGAVVVVGGPAGIGKTELLAAVRERAGERGFRVLAARGRELESGMAFTVVRQLVEAAVLSADARQRRRLLAGPARAGAGALGLAAGAAPDSEFAAVHGLYWLCVNLAGRGPLLVTVDDVQWADGPSLAWLGYLGHRAAELPVLVVVSVREGDPAARAPAVAAVVNDPAVHRIGLLPLSTDSVTALVRADLGPAASAGFCAACGELSGGNPLYVRELLAAARSDGLTGTADDAAALRAAAPAAVGASMLARLARMGPDAGALARALAVLGSRCEVAAAAELADLDPVAAELAADGLAAAQILAPDRPLEFFHPLIGEAVYADLAPGARRIAHRLAATIVDRAGAVDRVAAHLLATGPAGDGWVAGRLAAAARTARERGAPEVAASYLRRALAEPPAAPERPALLLQLGEAEWHAGQPAAIAHLEEALAGAGDVPTVAAAAWTLAYAYTVSDRADLAAMVLQRAIAPVSAADPLLTLWLEAAAALAGVMDDRTAPAALRAVERLREHLDDVADPPVHLLVVVAQVAVRRAQSPAEAQQLIERALARTPYPPPLDTCPPIIMTLLELESFGMLQRLCEDMLAAARRRAAAQELTGIANLSAAVLLRRGELADAEAQAHWALERATGIYAIHALALLIRTLIERDALEEADTELARTAPPLDSHSIAAPAYLIARGQLRAAQGRNEEALADFLACGQRCERLGITLGIWPWRSEAAIAHALLGHAQEARPARPRRGRRRTPVRAAARAGRRTARPGPGRGRHPRPGPALGGGYRPGAIAVTGRAGPRAHRLRRRAAPGRPARPGPRPAGTRPGPGPSLRRAPHCGPGPRGTGRRRRQAAPGRGHRPRRADRQRAAGGPAGSRRPHQPGDRPVAVHHHQDRLRPPQPRLPQARHHPQEPACSRSHQPSRRRTRATERRRDAFLGHLRCQGSDLCPECHGR